MKPSTKIVWMGYASIILAPVWGIGVIPAVLAIRLRRTVHTNQITDLRIQRDLRGGVLLARAGLVLNAIVLAMIGWIFLSTRVF